MNVGISIAKDLAVIVGIDSLENPGEKLVRMFTPDDGRAFRGVPYFKHWVSEKQIQTHAIDIEIDFDRALVDFCFNSRTRGLCRIGYSENQVMLVKSNFPGIECLPVPQIENHNNLLMLYLNEQAKKWGGYLYPHDHVMQYMWTSLPLDGDGNRFLPTKKNPAIGRIDGIRALLNCLSVSHGLVERLMGRAIAEKKREDLKKFLPSLHQHEWLWVKHRFHGIHKERPAVAVPLIWRGELEFVCPGKAEETECPKTSSH